MKRAIVDISILQSVPPSNLNRDDTGSPKTAVYGGVLRARVSSQAWKHAARKDFGQHLQSSELGMRTKRLVAELADRAKKASGELSDEEAERLSAELFKAAGLKLTSPRKREGEDQRPDESEFLVFLSNSQFERLAAIVVAAAESDDEAKTIKVAKPKEILKEEHSVDIALFGRMIADHTDLTVDAAAQVAHAISVHEVKNDYDYFTAVDDAKSDEAGDDAGAAMIGTIEFNSSTLYRYATVDANRLLDNLGDVEATRRAIEAFVRSFTTSMPSGKQNTFANRTLPDAVIVSMRDTQSVNLVGAFEEPVQGVPRLAQASVALAEHAEEIDESYGTAPVASWVVRVGKSTEPLDALGENVSFETLVQGLGSLVAERLDS